MDYGTGAIFGCPAHDERDHKLALSMNLAIKQVIENKNIAIDVNCAAYVDARQKSIEELEKRSLGKRTTNYRLKDWGVSRQRFWGCPIPIIYCNICGAVPVPEDNLPIILPKDVIFDGHGNPLDAHPNWKHTNCPKCHENAIRETDTFDTFFESSWYFTRYCDVSAKEMTNKESCDYWLPVDQYIGGIEHAVMHLLYARFFTKLMNEQKIISIREPFINLLNQGMVLHATYKDSNNQFLYPDEVVKQGDKLVHKESGLEVTKGRIEKMNSPPEKDLEWSASGIEGCSRFIAKLQNMLKVIAMYNNQTTIIQKDSKINLQLNSQSFRQDEFETTPCASVQIVREQRRMAKNSLVSSFVNDAVPDQKQLLKLIHSTIKYVAEDIVSFKLNKAIARMRELFNNLSDKLSENNILDIELIKEGFSILIRLLNPFIPHITEEIWQRLGNTERLYKMPFPTFDKSLLIAQSYIIAIQINGKLKETHEFDIAISNEEIKKIAINLPKIQKYIEGKEAKKIILIPQKAY
ncbi:unnamed protein product [Oppiella nova]|uniref:leucine--tRNA ligase n=1 Tax=Oppiella nova TaxID=334625 RepID=A0A7R9LAJ3_9ACAR|nr:unnamed protein product [Oppiella nova]CAG2161603.1 unnamed protein product [Oppiella nova]